MMKSILCLLMVDEISIVTFDGRWNQNVAFVWWRNKYCAFWWSMESVLWLLMVDEIKILLLFGDEIVLFDGQWNQCLFISDEINIKCFDGRWSQCCGVDGRRCSGRDSNKGWFFFVSRWEQMTGCGSNEGLAYRVVTSRRPHPPHLPKYSVNTSLHRPTR